MPVTNILESSTDFSKKRLLGKLFLSISNRIGNDRFELKGGMCSANTVKITEYRLALRRDRVSDADSDWIRKQATKKLKT